MQREKETTLRKIREAIGNIPNLSQEGKVLKTLKMANGEWVNKQFFVRTLFLTQAGRAIHNLEKNPRWRKEYEGYEIQHSEFRDEFGFKSYRLVPSLMGQTQLF